MSLSIVEVKAETVLKLDTSTTGFSKLDVPDVEVIIVM
jgi:hypothetical protein